MGAPQGLIYFSGIQAILQASFALSDGIQPSLATIYLPPQDSPIPEVGDLIVAYGGQQIVWPDSKVVHCHDDFSTDGTRTIGLTIADFRWRWASAKISGEYNLRDDAQNLRQNKAKTAVKNIRELCELLLKALGVSKFDMGTLDDKDFPEVRWDYDRADTALAELVDRVGFRVCPRQNNSIALCSSGVGAKLSRSAEVLSINQSIIPLTQPQSIIFIAGRTKSQALIELEMVGEDTDGTIKLPEKLSYFPRKFGWDIPYFKNVDENILRDNIDSSRRQLAQRTMFKMFRPKLPLKLPGIKEPIEDLFSIELTPFQIFEQVVAGLVENRPAWVFGDYYHNSHQESLDGNQDIRDPVKKPRGFWWGSVQIDSDRNLVMLDDLCYRLQNGKAVAPKIWLYTAVHVRRTDDTGWRRFEVKRTLGGNRSPIPPVKIVHDDVSYTIANQLDGKRVDNLESPIQTPGVPADVGLQTDPSIALRKVADYYIDAEIEIRKINESGSATFAGFLDQPLDGAIRQVVWAVSESGDATTTISRNTEVLGVTPSYAERSFNAKMGAIIDRQGQNAKLKKQNRR